MSWSDLSRDQKLVTVFTVLTALMHLAFSPTFTDEDVFGINLALLFVVNGIGYFVILYLLYFGGPLQENRNMVRYLLGIWTLGSILAWALWHPGDSHLDSSLSNKIVEVLLLVFLYLDMSSSAE